MPTLYFNSFAIGNNWLNLYQPETNYGVGDNVSKTIRNHSLSFGGDFRYYQLNARNTCGPNGYFNFNGVETGADVSDYFMALRPRSSNAPFSCSTTVPATAAYSSRIPGRRRLISPLTPASAGTSPGLGAMSMAV